MESTLISASQSRRSFLKRAGSVAAAFTVIKLRASHGTALPGAQTTLEIPWYRRVTRWGQTNITEADPKVYDITWWREHWRKTETQGVIINAGGIVAYYPSKVPFHRPAKHLEGRDLFGELCRAAHDQGLAVFARMDSNRAQEDFYRAHPDYFAVDAEGQPHKAGDLFVTCVNGPYYEEHIPAILREIIERYHPEGFTDNSWSGLGRGSPCFCANCQAKFKECAGHSIPARKDWNDPIYRQWIKWNYQRRLEIWDLNNRVTRAAGGANCIWAGMNSGSISSQCQSFRDYREICRRADIIMLDHQSRSDSSGFQNNGEIGKLVHELLGWDKLIPESMAMYQAGKPTFRLASKPEPEARLWMLDGVAGGLQPWWHHVGAYHEDRRMYQTAGPVYHWHKSNERYLIDRRPIATVAVLWSQENTDFFGRDNSEVLVDLPWRGLTQSLIRARIPYVPIHADDLEREAPRFSAIVLPNLGVMSQGQITAVRRFVERGGGLLATGLSSLFDEGGDPRPDFALADLFGGHTTKPVRNDAAHLKSVGETAHTYLRLTPELRARVDGPHVASEPAIEGERHPVFSGFDDTDIIPFGGTLDSMRVDPGTQVLLTFIPPFPIYPPETAWMRESKTDVPGLLLKTTPSGGRVAFLPADLDRRYGRDNLPDHGRLLANLVRWVTKDNLPLWADGPGLLDVHLYHQPGRLVLHLVNLTNAGAWRQPVDELIPVGPISVRLRLLDDVRGKHLRLLVAGRQAPVKTTKGWAQFQLDSILDHEVAVLM